MNDRFGKSIDAILKHVSVIKNKNLTLKCSLKDQKTIIFYCSKNYGRPIRVTRLNVPPNMTDPVSLNENLPQPYKYNFTSIQSHAKKLYLHMVNIVDTALSLDKELIICSFLQDISKEKESSLQLICNAQTAFWGQVQFRVVLGFILK